VIVLLWVYYSAQIFLLGAEFTWVYSYRHGTRTHLEKPAAKSSTPRAAEAAAQKQEGGTPAQPSTDSTAPSPRQSAPPAPRRPAVGRLRIAAGIAAAVGLVAGEVLSELRRQPPLARGGRRH